MTLGLHAGGSDEIRETVGCEEINKINWFIKKAFVQKHQNVFRISQIFSYITESWKLILYDSHLTSNLVIHFP